MRRATRSGPFVAEKVTDSIERLEAKVVGVGLVTAKEVGGDNAVCGTMQAQGWDGQAVALPATQQNPGNSRSVLRRGKSRGG
jgi:hypothetical protein